MKPLRIPLPKNTLDETGHTYGRLRVLAYAGLQSGKAAWECRCDCRGKTGHPGRAIARGDRLRTGRIVSCGCERADPAVRQAARLTTPTARRRAIARMGGAARWGKA